MLITSFLMMTLPASVVYCYRKEGRKEGNVLFNDALNTFYLRLYLALGRNGEGPFR